MDYPKTLFFDIETLINVAQPSRILLIGDCEDDFLNNYREQKSLIQQKCQVSLIKNSEIDQLWKMDQPFDVAIVINLFEHVDKNKGMQVLSRLQWKAGI